MITLDDNSIDIYNRIYTIVQEKFTRFQTHIFSLYANYDKRYKRENKISKELSRTHSNVIKSNRYLGTTNTAIVDYLFNICQYRNTYKFKQLQLKDKQDSLNNILTERVNFLLSQIPIELQPLFYSQTLRKENLTDYLSETHEQNGVTSYDEMIELIQVEWFVAYYMIHEQIDMQDGYVSDNYSNVFWKLFITGYEYKLHEKLLDSNNSRLLEILKDTAIHTFNWKIDDNFPINIPLLLQPPNSTVQGWETI